MIGRSSAPSGAVCAPTLLTFWLLNTPHSVHVVQRFQTFSANARLIASAASRRTVGVGTLTLDDQVLVDHGVLEPAEVQRQRAHRRGGTREPPEELHVRVGATVVAPALGLERTDEGEADVLALLDRGDRHLDLAAEGIVPHAGDQLVGLDVERVVGGVERELDRVGPGVGLALLELRLGSVDVELRVAAVLEVAERTRRERTVRRDGQPGAALVGECAGCRSRGRAPCGS